MTQQMTEPPFIRVQGVAEIKQMQEEPLALWISHAWSQTTAIPKLGVMLRGTIYDELYAPNMHESPQKHPSFSDLEPQSFKKQGWCSKTGLFHTKIAPKEWIRHKSLRAGGGGRIKTTSSWFTTSSYFLHSLAVLCYWPRAHKLSLRFRWGHMVFRHAWHISWGKS